LVIQYSKLDGFEMSYRSKTKTMNFTSESDTGDKHKKRITKPIKKRRVIKK
jgi:hypothetical protein